MKGCRPSRERLGKAVAFLGYRPDAAIRPEDLVKALIAARLELRLPRSEMAELLDVSYSALWVWETGSRRPRGKSFVRALSFLTLD